MCKLKATVRCRGFHFTCAVLDNCWKYIDDMQDNLFFFSSLDQLYANVEGGWFFGIYILCDNPEMIVLNFETMMPGMVSNCETKPRVKNRSEYYKKYYSANKELLKEKARQRRAKKKEQSSKERTFGMTSGGDDKKGMCTKEEPVDKCKRFNKSKSPAHNARSLLAERFSSNTPNQLDDSLPIHEQEFALKNMEKFHKSMSMKISQCGICHEA